MEQLSYLNYFHSMNVGVADCGYNNKIINVGVGVAMLN